MGTDAPSAISFRLTPNLARLLAFGWVAAVAFVWLFQYEAWVYPLQWVHVVVKALPALRFGPHFDLRWREALCVAGILATAFPVGAVILRRFTIERNLLTGLFALAAGLWVVAVAVLVVGSVSVRAVPGVFILAGCWALPAPRRFFHKTKLGRLDGWAKVMLALIVVAAGLNLLGALTPPFEYDELEYHLGAPAEYLKAGRIVLLPHNFYSNLPQLTEMLYLLAMVVRSGVAAKLLHWSFGLLTAVAVYAVAARLWSRRVAWTAAGMFYCVPFVQDLSQTARIDLATTFFATLAFGALLVWREPKCRDNWLWLSALAAGAAVATKWPAVAVVLVPAMAFVAVCRRSLRPLSVFGLLSSVIVLPWLVKNWWLAGNPVYPLLNGWFASPHWGVAQAAVFAEKHYPHFNGAGWWEFLERAWQYSFAERGAVPVLLMSVPLILLVRKADRRVQQTAWLVVAIYVGWWAGTFRPWRFLFPMFPVVALVGGCALEAAGKWARWIVGAVLVVGLTGMGAQVLIDTENPERVPAEVSFVDVALGRIADDEFLARIGNGMFEPIVWMNQHLSATAKVLYIGEARVALARHPVVWATAFDQHPVMRGVTDVTHVYINNAEWQRLREHYDYLLDLDSAAFRHFMEEHAQVIHTHGRGMVYELR
jgi:hypothetical protein